MPMAIHMSPIITNHKADPDVPLNIEQVTATFKKHDKNGDNLLSKEELKEAFKELGSRWPSIRTSLGIHHADANKDGFISEDELKVLVSYALKLGYKVR